MTEADFRAWLEQTYADFSPFNPQTEGQFKDAVVAKVGEVFVYDDPPGDPGV